MNSFGSQSTLKVGNKSFEIFRLQALEAKGLALHRLPYSLRVLLENLLRANYLVPRVAAGARGERLAGADRRRCLPRPCFRRGQERASTLGRLLRGATERGRAETNCQRV